MSGSGEQAGAASDAEPASTEAAAVAVALGRTSRSRDLDGEAAAFLRDQRKLVNLQMEHLHEERELHHRHLHLKYFGDRLRIGLQLLAIAVGLFVVVGAGLMVWQASRANGLVVDVFSVPPELAQKGLTGEVLASQVLDRLAQLDTDANRVRAIDISDGWSANTRLQIPETGLSLDEVSRMLRRWLGHEIHLTGELVQAPEGIVLTARTGAGQTVRVTGDLASIAATTDEAAEQLFAKARPAQYGFILAKRLRYDDAEQLFKSVIRSSDSEAERSTAHAGLGSLYNTEHRLPEALTEARFSVGERHVEFSSYINLMFIERGTGHWEAARQQAERAIRLPRRQMGRTGRASDRNRVTVEGAIAYFNGDFTAYRASMSDEFVATGSGRFDADQHQDRVDANIWLHDLDAARAELPLVQQTSINVERRESFRVSLSLRIAAEAQDWPEVLRLIETATVQPNAGQINGPTPDLWRALALARLGRIPEARAVAATLPRDCYRCQINASQVAEIAGDRAGADRALAEAIGQNPSIFLAHVEWGRLKLARGDLAGAMAEAKTAIKLGPRNADAHLLAAETLAAQGNAASALAEFQSAQALAPRWGRLHLKWGEALAKLGKTNEAQAQFKAAATLDLTPSERGELSAQSGAPHV